MKEIVVLFSGGPDSLLALRRYLRRGYVVHALTLATEEDSREVTAARCLVNGLDLRHVIVDTSSVKQVFSDIPDMTLCVGGDANNGCGVKPNNGAPLGIELMHMMAAMYALTHGINTVAWAIQADEVPDPADLKRYLDLLSELITLRTGQGVGFELPIINLTKAEVLRELLALGVSIEETYSCNDKLHGPCGDCHHCLMRESAQREVYTASPSPGSPTLSVS